MSWMWLFRALQVLWVSKKHPEDPSRPRSLLSPSHLLWVPHLCPSVGVPTFGVMPHTRASLAPMAMWKLAAVQRVRLPCTSVSPLMEQGEASCAGEADLTHIPRY